MRELGRFLRRRVLTSDRPQPNRNVIYRDWRDLICLKESPTITVVHTRIARTIYKVREKSASSGDRSLPMKSQGYCSSETPTPRSKTKFGLGEYPWSWKSARPRKTKSATPPPIARVNRMNSAHKLANALFQCPISPLSTSWNT